MGPNEVNYSILNGGSMETNNQPGKEKSRKYKKYERSGNMAKDVKKDENGGKIGNLMEPGNRNEIKLMKTDGKSNGKDVGATSKAQQKKCENPTSNTDALMAMMAETRAIDIEKGIKETKEKERKELYRKEKEEREELVWKEAKESSEEFQRILSNAGVRGFGTELAKGYESPMKNDVESDGTGRDVTGESQGSTGPVRRKFRKFGLKKMERNMKEGNYTGKIKHLTVQGN